MKAAVPITGGISMPPLEAAASTAAAKAGLKPERFIRGMVTAPVITILAPGDPVTIPTRPLDITELWAAPPRNFCPTSRPTKVKNSLAFVISNMVPKRTNKNMILAEIYISEP